MRPIKFRAWDKEGKGWVAMGAMLQVKAHGEMLLDPGESVELMQFTGLLDKNGKEIYEGDILWNGDWIEDAHAYNDLGNSVVQYESSKWFCGFNGMNGEAVEVIGNIYENPELIKSI